VLTLPGFLSSTPARDILRFCSAAVRTGRARAIEQNGLFLGMFRGAVYASLEIPLKPGDRYVLTPTACPNPKTPRTKSLGLRAASNFFNPILFLPPQNLLTKCSVKSLAGPHDRRAVCREMT
jgi:hypothetical protein